MKKKQVNKTPLEPTVDVNDELKKLVAVFIITNKGLKETYFKKIIKEGKANYMLSFPAKDINYKPNVIFETQMYDSSQEIHLIICPNHRVNKIMDIVDEQCRLLVQAKAQVLSVPLSSVINYRFFRFLGAK